MAASGATLKVVSRFIQDVWIPVRMGIQGVTIRMRRGMGGLNTSTYGYGGSLSV